MCVMSERTGNTEMEAMVGGGVVVMALAPPCPGPDPLVPPSAAPPPANTAPAAPPCLPWCPGPILGEACEAPTSEPSPSLAPMAPRRGPCPPLPQQGLGQLPL